MHTLVRPQCRTAGAVLSTAGTPRGLGTRQVRAQVLEQVLLLTEAAATVRAWVWPLTCVVAQVPREVGLLAEAAAAFRARVGPLSCVDALMDIQR